MKKILLLFLVITSCTTPKTTTKTTSDPITVPNVSDGDPLFNKNQLDPRWLQY